MLQPFVVLKIFVCVRFCIGMLYFVLFLTALSALSFNRLLTLQTFRCFLTPFRVGPLKVAALLATPILYRPLTGVIS